MKVQFMLFMVIALAIVGCNNNLKNKETNEMKRNDTRAEVNATKNIDAATIKMLTDTLIKQYGDSNKFRIERGLQQLSNLWDSNDGDVKEFTAFCMNNFIGDREMLDKIFLRISDNFETIYGSYNKIYLSLLAPKHLDIYEILPVDDMFATYSPYTHVTDDMFKNKLAFFIQLNFPSYTLAEKNELGKNWSRKEWAYARMGDMFTTRVPAEIAQALTNAYTEGDDYISNYNIYAGNLIDDEGKEYFAKDKVLITHWNLRDELKSQYSYEDGLFKQQMIYEVMKRIISQEIPQEVINSGKYQWNPFKNTVSLDGKKIDSKPEPNTRYLKLLNNFRANKAVDEYSPQYPTTIKRKFDQEMEIPQEEVEKLFVEFVSSPTAKKVGELIKKRLGRDLQAFDIWYDGFKSRSSISEEELDAKTKKLYPDRFAFKKGLPSLLKKLGFNKARAEFIASKIDVDPSRGAGHAWGSEMKDDNAHLRTRIGKEGMNYKGYNIAVHEFGHNVEQTITLQDVDYYMLKGVPHTAFTEAWAFIFQKRDLELLGMKEKNENKKYMDALDNFWSIYEIMGVSLVDMRVWKWMYEHPDADEKQLKEAVIDIAKAVWNEYYAPVFGIKDEPILAIYSHMIDNPLYLSAYPLGHLIEFQMDSYMEGKNLADEMVRICKQGKLTPQQWMIGAVGNELSIEPTINATEEALSWIKAEEEKQAEE